MDGSRSRADCASTNVFNDLAVSATDGDQSLRSANSFSCVSSAGHQLAERSIVFSERHDLITKKRRRSATFKPGSHPGISRSPPWMSLMRSATVEACKGQFKIPQRPLTAIPSPSRTASARFLNVECHEAVLWPHRSESRSSPVFIKTFREFGLPAVIRSDNGMPFGLPVEP